MLSQHELQEVVTSSLKKLGLEDGAIALYLLSLKQGPMSINALAKHLNVSRPQAYKLITELEKFGLTDFSTRKKFARTFMVESPSKLQELLRKQQDLIAQTDQRLSWLMPELLATYQQGEIPSTVRILHDREQFLKVFFQCAEESANNEIRVLGSSKDFISFITWAENRRWIDLRVQRKAKLLALLFPSEETMLLQKNDQQELRETRVLTALKPFNTLIMMSANKTIMWQPHAPMAVLIEDEYFMQMYRSLFDGLWEQHKKPPHQP